MLVPIRYSTLYCFVFTKRRRQLIRYLSENYLRERLAGLCTPDIMTSAGY